METTNYILIECNYLYIYMCVCAYIYVYICMGKIGIMEIEWHARP